jgi:hypothetical protein
MKGTELSQGGSGVEQKNQNQRIMRRNSFNPLTLYRVSVTDHRKNQRQGGEVMFIEESGREDPAGGYEVLSKPPLGKCSINITDAGESSAAEIFAGADPPSRFPPHEGRSDAVEGTLRDLNYLSQTPFVCT